MVESSNPLRPSRRQLLAGASGCALGAVASFIGSRVNHGRPRRLVCIQLTGGNDGLSTIVPYSDPAYSAARFDTRHEEVLRIDDYRGFHPGLGVFLREWRRGSLAIVEGVSLPEPVRSHFKALEIWHKADPKPTGKPGWLTVLASALYPSRLPAHAIVHLGTSPPASCVSSSYQPIVIEDPRAYRFSTAPSCSRMGTGSSVLGAVALAEKQLNSALSTSAALSGLLSYYSPKVEYPDTEFGNRLRNAAALLKQFPETRMVSTSFEGFDTHGKQRPQHDGRVEQLNRCLTAFLDDTGPGQTEQDFLILLFSEFGRRVAENASRGTDHGLAGPAFVLGPKARGGLCGVHPSLTDLQGGDLKGTSDFRGLYATIWRRMMGSASVPASLARFPAHPF